MSWYRTGTVAVTNGSKTVTGVGTLFTTAVNVGDAFALVDGNLNPTGAWYEVDAVVSNTEITLKQSYAGTTGSNNQYCVFNMVGNMTTPSFAQRLATFFASFQSLIDKPTATPTALGIPVADANGDIDSGWLKDASETTKGIIELATPAEVLAGMDEERAVTPAGFKAAFGEFYPTGVTSTYVDSTHFTVLGDLTAIFTKGRVLKITDTGGTFNAICSDSAYDNGTELTTVTVAGDTIDSRISAVLYAVQQVTGQIWESGSNANGEYVKFADGTMICTIVKTIQANITNAAGSLWMSYDIYVNLPASFYNLTYVATGTTKYDTGTPLWSSVTQGNSSQIYGRIIDLVQRTAAKNVVLCIVCIGRWF